MNKLLSIGLMLVSLFILQGCNNDNKTKNNKVTHSSHVPTVIIPPSAEDDKEPVVDDDKDEVDDSQNNNDNLASCDATANPINAFIRVQTHYGLLRGQPHLSGETGGLLPLSLTKDAAKGDLVLEVDSTISLLPQQLITYLGEDYDYNVAKILSLELNKIILDNSTPLASSVSSGQNLWNFYNDPNHPNAIGFNALADFAFRSVATTIDDNATHVLLGDSWFSIAGFAERLALRFPNATIINKGYGGNTLCDLLARFDADVPSSAPKYVWINSSINDYYNDVSQEDFKVRLQDLISKVQAIGATAIVLDSAPGASGMTADGLNYLTLTQRYASQLLDLYNEAQANP